MCDPFSLTLAGAGLTAATSIGRAQSQRNLVEAQNDANAAVAQHQRRMQQLERERQDARRQQSIAAHQETLSEITPDAQSQTVEDETARLTDALTEGSAAPVPLSDALLSGQRLGGEHFQTDVARRVADESADARQRIAALARQSAYGDSFGGLSNVIAEAFQGGNEEINLQNDARRGSLAALDRELALEPRRFVLKANPLNDILSAAGQTALFAGGAGLAGGGAGTGAQTASALRAQSAPRFTGGPFRGI